MKIGSLFSGIGGLERGLEAALDAETIWQVEQAEYPRRVLAKHWPKVKRYVDVRMVQRVFELPDGSTRTVQPLAPVDLICGGFPCQDVSVAGKAAGLAGSRSGLWFEFARIVRDLRPRFVVVENVLALRKRGLGTVLGGLAALGYCAEWACLSATDVGAPHLRKRIFIVAWLPNTGRGSVRLEQSRKQRPSENGRERVEAAARSRTDGEPEPMADRDGRRCQVERVAEPRRVEGPRRGISDRRRSLRRLDDAATMVDPDDSGRAQQRRPVDSGPQFGATERSSRGRAKPRMGGTFDGVPRWIYGGSDPEIWEGTTARTIPAKSISNRPARLRALGNAVTPQQAAEIGLRVRSLLRGER